MEEPRSVTFMTSDGEGAVGWLIKDNNKTVIVRVGCKYFGKIITRHKKKHKVTIWPEKIIMKNFMSQERYNKYWGLK